MVGFAENDECGYERIAEPVETMMTADGLRLTAYRPDKDRIRFVELTADRSRRTADSLRPTANG